jgi:hypothetical protein
MARGRRFTIRLDDREHAAIEAFADDNHLLASVALRWLISRGLAEHSARSPEVRQDDSGPSCRRAPTPAIADYVAETKYRRRLLMMLGIWEHLSWGVPPNGASLQRVRCICSAFIPAFFRDRARSTNISCSLSGVLFDSRQVRLADLTSGARNSINSEASSSNSLSSSKEKSASRASVSSSKPSSSTSQGSIALASTGESPRLL